MVLLWSEGAFSQRSQGVFGPAIDFPLAKTPAGLVLTSAGAGRAALDLVTADPPGVERYVLTERGELQHRAHAPLRSRCRSWVVADLDARGPALLGLTQDEDTLVIARGRGPDAFDEVLIPLSCRPHHVLAADIDADRQKELLLFGKSMGGVQVLKKRRGGSYTAGPLLFPDISASAVAVTELNGDGIPDVFLANWLSNQVALFFGIAPNVFSEQVTIDLNAEPGSIALTAVTKRRTIQVAVLLPEANQIAVFSGNGAGEFHEYARIATPLSPEQAEFVHLNGDAWPDLLISGNQGLQTVLARSAIEFEAPVVYGVGNTLDLWQVADIDGDRSEELVCADRRGRRLIIASRRTSLHQPPLPATLLAGERPQGVLLDDADGDGLTDILVANQGSASVSCFLNRGSGTFAPQITIGTAEKPSTLRLVDGETRRFLVAHGGEGKLSLISTAAWNAPAVFSIPTAADPVILRALRRSREEPLRILVRSRGGAQESATFSLFEQLTGKTFLEKTFTTVLPTAFRGITTASISNGMGTDLVFLTADRAGKTYTLSCASPGEDFSYTKVQTLFTLTDSVSSPRAIRAVDLDGDGLEDLLIVGSGRAEGVGALFAQPGGFEPAVTWIDGLLPPVPETIVVEDLNGDGHRDYLAIDQGSRTIRVAYGAGGRRFLAPRTVVSSSGASSLAVGSLVDPRLLDLVFSTEERGTVSVLFHPFVR